MQRVKRAAAVLAVAAAAALTLTSCGTKSNDTINAESGNAAVVGDGWDSMPYAIYPHPVKLPDGRTVLCVWEKGNNAGGLSCDWSNAK